MKVCYVWFEDPSRDDFKRLTDVFLHSIRKNSPDLKVEGVQIPYPKERFNVKNNAHFENIYKLRYWNEIIQNSEETVLLIDTDILIAKDISDISDIELKQTGKDIVFTSRAGYSDILYNCGVILVRPTKRAKQFFQEWYNLSANEFNPNDKGKWHNLFVKYRGATQSTFGYLREEGKYEDIIGELPCYNWNVTHTDWGKYNKEKSKIIHIKGKLRQYILSNTDEVFFGTGFNDTGVELMKLWYSYEAKMIQSDPDKYKGREIITGENIKIVERKTPTRKVPRRIGSEKNQMISKRVIKKATPPKRISTQVKKKILLKEEPKTIYEQEEFDVYFNWFESKQRLNFKRLTNVFKKSFIRTNPDINLIEEKLPYPKKEQYEKTIAPNHYENIYKLKYWNDAVQKATRPVLLIDSDMLITQDIKDISALGREDITFTTRDESYSDLKCNGGVIYVRPTDKAKQFFQEWYDVSLNEFNPTDKGKWQAYYKKYKGATQSTLGYLRERGDYEDVIGEIPCYLWNATPIEIDYIDDNTKIIHIKGTIRRSILKNTLLHKYANSTARDIASKWLAEENR